MTRILTAVMAATIAATSLGVATAADAQARGPVAREQHQEHREERRDLRQDQRQEQRALARYQRAERHYSAPRYAPPRGYVARQWSYGQRLPANYRTRAYVVNNYSSYGLRAPPRGYQYTRVGNDVVLTAVATGLITAVIAGLFN